MPETTKLEFRGDVQNVLSGMIPRVYNHSYAISADLVVPDGGVEGVIVAEADHLGGFSLFVEDGKLTHTYSMMGVFIFRQQATEPLPTGEVNVRMEFAADAPKPATGGQVTLYVNDQGGRWRPHGPHGADALLGLRRHGHRPRQRRRRRPELRLEGAVPVHRDDPQGRLRHQAAPRARGSRAARGRRRTPTSPTR